MRFGERLSEKLSEIMAAGAKRHSAIRLVRGSKFIRGLMGHNVRCGLSCRSRGRAAGPWRRVIRRTALQAAAGLIVVILLLTLWPLPGQAYRASLSPIYCLVCGDQGMQDVIQNVIMLLPLGLLLGLAGFRPGRAALVAFGLALMIETLQYFVVPGRDAALSDVVTNTTGAWLGALLAPRLPLLLRPGPRPATRLALAAVVGWAAAWVFGAWASSSNTGAGNWRGRAPNDLPDARAFSGAVEEVAINGTRLLLAPAESSPRGGGGLRPRLLRARRRRPPPGGGRPARKPGDDHRCRRVDGPRVQ